MSRSNKQMEFYENGIMRAYQLVKDGGVEALEQEVKFRKLTGINSVLMNKELNHHIEDIKALCIKTVLTIALGTLYSEFKFGNQRLNRFKNVFMEGTNCLNDGIVTWLDVCYNIEDETGIHVELIDDLNNNTWMIKEDR